MESTPYNITNLTVANFLHWKKLFYILSILTSVKHKTWRVQIPLLLNMENINNYLCLSVPSKMFFSICKLPQLSWIWFLINIFFWYSMNENWGHQILDARTIFCFLVARKDRYNIEGIILKRLIFQLNILRLFVPYSSPI